jgi:ankyrin repeat protein
VLGAARDGDAKALREVLAQGVPGLKALRDAGGRSALTLAVLGGHMACLDALLEYGADANAMDSNESSPAMMAACEGHWEMLEKLLAAGCDPNGQFDQEHSMLMLAAMSREPECVRVLVKFGADVDYRRPDGQTAAMDAAEMGCPESLALIGEAGADLRARAKHGKTALSLASKKAGWPQRPEELAGKKQCAMYLATAMEKLELGEAVQKARSSTVAGPRL